MSSSDLQPRDHQLLAHLETAFGSFSFIQYSHRWETLGASPIGVNMVPGDVESIRRLVRAGKVTYLGTKSNRPHYSINE